MPKQAQPTWNPPEPGTVVPVEDLKAVVAATELPETLPVAHEFYMGLVAQAAKLELEDVLDKYKKGDRGIVDARMRVKALVVNKTRMPVQEETP